jgi:flagellar hook-associated protein 3 FlgL
MSRIASAMIPQAALADLSRAQASLVEAARQSSAQTRADDLKGFGRETQTLVSAERLAARTEGFIATTRELTTRMEIQDVALARASEVVGKLKNELFQAAGLESGEGVRAMLEEAFAVLRDAMNASIGGRYLFGGVVNDRPPVIADTLADLAANPLADSLETGAAAQQMRIEEGRVIAAGLVADDIATDAFASIKRLAEFDAGALGPFGGMLTAPQKQAIVDELGALSDAFDRLLLAQSENGRLLQTVDAAAARQREQLTALNAAVGDIVSVDLAEVALKLNQAQFSYEASANVFGTLRELSLLNFLR